MDGRLDHAAYLETQFFSRAVYFCDYTLMLCRIFNDAAFTNFAFANFKLRFDKGDDAAAFSQQRNDSGQNFGCRDKGDIDRDQVELLVEVFRFQITSIDAFADFNAGIAAQSPIKLIVADI